MVRRSILTEKVARRGHHLVREYRVDPFSLPNQANVHDRLFLACGDCMLDEYLWGRVNRISPEAPVMVVEQVDTTYAAGGASNVAANIVAMDGEVEVLRPPVAGLEPFAVYEAQIRAHWRQG